MIYTNKDEEGNWYIESKNGALISDKFGRTYGLAIDKFAEYEHNEVLLKSIDESKESQINEIAKDLCSRYAVCTCTDRDGHCSTPKQHAEIIYGLGYKKQTAGTWISYSSTMMECSVCKRHVPYHKYEFCPHCGSKMIKEN
jgi:hypothetical protein